nr:mucin-5B [Kogia breviceps]
MGAQRGCRALAWALVILPLVQKAETQGSAGQSWMSQEATMNAQLVTFSPPITGFPTMSSLNAAHGGRVCSTWGDFHYKTFDGDVFRFPGLCNYVFSAHCGAAYEDFNLQLRRSLVGSRPTVTHIILKTQGLVLEVSNGSILVNGRREDLPYSRAGVLVEESSAYVRVNIRLMLAFTWNGEDSVLLELDPRYANQTCGLCGDFNGLPAISEFYAHNARLTPLQFGNLQKLDGPTEQCQDALPSPADNCTDGEGVCRHTLLGPAFAQCHRLVDAEVYVATCTQDLCRCPSCPCATFAEYSRQCAHAGGQPQSWRGPDLCPQTCPLNMQHQECGSPCADTCSNPERSQLCEDHCVDGCFCPLGMVLDDITHSGCLPLRQCPCMHGGRPYAPGASFTTSCSSCTCSGGLWQCQDLPCPGICSIQGGSHISTYDEKLYDVHGDCSYILTKICAGNALTVLAELRKCGLTDNENCLRTVMLSLNGGDTTIQIQANGEVFVNSIYTQLPVSVANITVFRPSSFFILVQTGLGLQLQVQLVPLMQVFLRLDPSYQGQMCGLCGNFNHNQADDFRTISGVVEGTAAAFANTWKTQAACPNVKNSFEDPCSLSVENENYALHWCSLLTDPAGAFSSCHSVISPGPFHSNCMFDTCNCEKSEDCMCAALSSYVWACAARGVLLSGWRDGVCNKYVSSCPKTQSYAYVVDSCQPTCRSLSQADVTCDVAFVPVDGCTCPSGTFLDDTGDCVPIEACPCYARGSVLAPGEVLHDNGVMCSCAGGKLSCLGAVEQSTACVAPMLFLDCSNTSVDTPGAECVRSCHVPDVDCLSTHCVSGCVCPAGLLADGSGGCVAEEDCPCLHNEAAYKPGETIRVDCNTCTCRGRRWECSHRPCLGTCVAYGDGHFITFDGERYSFEGSCEYTLAQDYCAGNNGSNGNFRIVTENVPCGTTGVTCSKAIKIFLENFELILHEGAYKVVQRGPGGEPPYKIRYMGIYLAIETRDGVVVSWDRKTSVFIRLHQEYKGRVCGLCGNFDDNALNDFTTRSQSVVGDALEFGNSWKFSPSCPDAQAPKDPCAANPYRKSWAQKQCSIINSATFSACRSQVDSTRYYEACVSDACACDSGGDCECFCTAVAAYAQACRDAGVCVSWRSPDTCPLFCDYYNPHGECEWHYQPCGAPCLRTCRNPRGHCLTELPGLEGCYPQCPPSKPFFNEDQMKCVAQCGGCYDEDGNYYDVGTRVPTAENCQSCDCTPRGLQCTYSPAACTCTYEGRTYSYGDVIYNTTDGLGACLIATCRDNGTIVRKAEECPRTLPTMPFTFTSTAAPLSTMGSVPTPSTVCVQEHCRWSDWYDSGRPELGAGGGDFETFENLRQRGYQFCPAPVHVECRAQEFPDIPLEKLGQKVECGQAWGLTCLNREQNPPPCHNYELRVLCCDYVPCGTSPAPGTSQQPSSQPLPTSTQTTPTRGTSLLSMAASTSQTPSANSTSTVTRVGSSSVLPATTTCEPRCQWTEWFDEDYPKSEEAGGDVESYDKIRRAGGAVCEQPQGIECQAENFPDVRLEELNQRVHCDVSFGLVCRNNEQVGLFKMCYNYKIRVLCCGYSHCGEPTSPTTTATTSTATVPTATTSTATALTATAPTSTASTSTASTATVTTVATSTAPTATTNTATAPTATASTATAPTATTSTATLTTVATSTAPTATASTATTSTATAPTSTASTATVTTAATATAPTATTSTAIAPTATASTATAQSATASTATLTTVATSTAPTATASTATAHTATASTATALTATTSTATATASTATAPTSTATAFTAPTSTATAFTATTSTATAFTATTSTATAFTTTTSTATAPTATTSTATAFTATAPTATTSTATAPTATTSTATLTTVATSTAPTAIAPTATASAATAPTATTSTAIAPTTTTSTATAHTATTSTATAPTTTTSTATAPTATTSTATAPTSTASTATVTTVATATAPTATTSTAIAPTATASTATAPSATASTATLTTVATATAPTATASTATAHTATASTATAPTSTAPTSTATTSTATPFTATTSTATAPTATTSTATAPTATTSTAKAPTATTSTATAPTSTATPPTATTSTATAPTATTSTATAPTATTSTATAPTATTSTATAFTATAPTSTTSTATAATATTSTATLTTVATSIAPTAIALTATASTATAPTATTSTTTATTSTATAPTATTSTATAFTTTTSTAIAPTATTSTATAFTATAPTATTSTATAPTATTSTATLTTVATSTAPTAIAPTATASAATAPTATTSTAIAPTATAPTATAPTATTSTATPPTATTSTATAPTTTTSTATAPTATASTATAPTTTTSTATALTATTSTATAPTSTASTATLTTVATATAPMATASTATAHTATASTATAPTSTAPTSTATTSTATPFTATAPTATTSTATAPTATTSTAKAPTATAPTATTSTAKAPTAFTATAPTSTTSTATAPTATTSTATLTTVATSIAPTAIALTATASTATVPTSTATPPTATTSTATPPTATTSTATAPTTTTSTATAPTATTSTATAFTTTTSTAIAPTATTSTATAFTATAPTATTSTATAPTATTSTATLTTVATSTAPTAIAPTATASAATAPTATTSTAIAPTATASTATAPTATTSTATPPTATTSTATAPTTTTSTATAHTATTSTATAPTTTTSTATALTATTSTATAPTSTASTATVTTVATATAPTATTSTATAHTATTSTATAPTTTTSTATALTATTSTATAPTSTASTATVTTVATATAPTATTSTAIAPTATASTATAPSATASTATLTTVATATAPTATTSTATAPTATTSTAKAPTAATTSTATAPTSTATPPTATTSTATALTATTSTATAPTATTSTATAPTATTSTATAFTATAPTSTTSTATAPTATTSTATLTTVATSIAPTAITPTATASTATAPTATTSTTTVPTATTSTATAFTATTSTTTVPTATTSTTTAPTATTSTATPPTATTSTATALTATTSTATAPTATASTATVTIATTSTATVTTVTTSMEATSTATAPTPIAPMSPTATATATTAITSTATVTTAATSTAATATAATSAATAPMSPNASSTTTAMSPATQPRTWPGSTGVTRSPASSATPSPSLSTGLTAQVTSLRPSHTGTLPGSATSVLPTHTASRGPPPMLVTTQTSTSQLLTGTAVDTMGTTSMGPLSTSHPKTSTPGTWVSTATTGATTSQGTTGCQPKCQWTEWFDVDFPTSEFRGGDMETYDNIRAAGGKMCQQPQKIECRAESYPEVSIDQIGQVLSCSLEAGLVCRNEDQRGKFTMCFNYNIRVYCCNDFRHCSTMATTPLTSTAPPATGSSTATVPSPSTSATTQTQPTSTAPPATGSSTATLPWPLTSAMTQTQPASTAPPATGSSMATVPSPSTSATTQTQPTSTAPPATGSSMATLPWPSTSATTQTQPASTAPPATGSSTATLPWPSTSATTQTQPTSTAPPATGSSTATLPWPSTSTTTQTQPTSTAPPATGSSTATLPWPSTSATTQTQPTSTAPPATGSSTATQPSPSTSATTQTGAPTTAPATARVHKTTIGTTLLSTPVTSHTRATIYTHSLHPTASPQVTELPTRPFKTTPGPPITTPSTGPGTRASLSTPTPEPSTSSLGTTLSSSMATSTAMVSSQKTHISSPTSVTTSPETWSTACQPRCAWTDWLDQSYPTPGASGGDFETYANIQAAGRAICQQPLKLQCRAEDLPEVALQDLGQVVQCRLEEGLVCWNRDQSSLMCLNYQIRMFCCDQSHCPSPAGPTSTTPAPSPSTISTSTGRLSSEVTTQTHLSSPGTIKRVSTPTTLTGPSSTGTPKGVSTLTHVTGPSSTGTTQRVSTPTRVTGPSSTKTTQRVYTSTSVTGPFSMGTTERISTATRVTGPFSTETTGRVSTSTRVTGPSSTVTTQRVSTSTSVTGPFSPWTTQRISIPTRVTGPSSPGTTKSISTPSSSAFPGSPPMTTKPGLPSVSPTGPLLTSPISTSPGAPPTTPSWSGVTSGSPGTFPISTASPSPTTACLCHAFGKFFLPGDIVYNKTDGAGCPFLAVCNQRCDIDRFQGTCPTSSPSGTSASVPPVVPGCNHTVPPRQVNESWTLEDCTVALCEGDNRIVLLGPKPMGDVVCVNGHLPVRVQSGDGPCDYSYECECSCSGWGDTHYETFDGTSYSFLDNCTHVLMREIQPRHGNLRILLHNHYCEAAASCPRALSVHYESMDVVLTTTPGADGQEESLILFGHMRVRQSFSKNGLTVTVTGATEMSIEIPAIGVSVMFNGRVFQAQLSYSHFSYNTEGQCGTCTNSRWDDCRLPDGTTAPTCQDMARFWLVPSSSGEGCWAPTGLPPATSPPSPAPSTPTSTPCPPDPLCELMLSPVFAGCHGLIPPGPFFSTCVSDSCGPSRPGRPEALCQSLEAYSALCRARGVCPDWRNASSGLCDLTCPPTKVYKSCGPVQPESCDSRTQSPASRGLAEGCFCPDGHILFNSHTDVCVPECPCVGPDGFPKFPGERWVSNCQSCVCDEGSVSVQCTPVQCEAQDQPQECGQAGFVAQTRPLADNPCCMETLCVCNTNACPSSPPKCGPGEELACTQEEDSCCPTFSCQPQLCTYNGTVYGVGATFPSVTPCHTCTCLSEDTHDPTVQCEEDACDTTCPRGFQYSRVAGQCCGECVQTACLTSDGRLVQPNETWINSLVDNCTLYHCQAENGTSMLTPTPVACPDVSSCRGILRKIGCCYSCDEVDSCQVRTSMTVLRHRGCATQAAVSVPFCEGFCPGASRYAMGARATQCPCICCQETRAHQEVVTMQCPNGTAFQHTYTHVDECSCGPSCISSAQAPEDSTPIFPIYGSTTV